MARSTKDQPESNVLLVDLLSAERVAAANPTTMSLCVKSLLIPDTLRLERVRQDVPEPGVSGCHAVAINIISSILLIDAAHHVANRNRSAVPKVRLFKHLI